MEQKNKSASFNVLSLTIDTDGQVFNKTDFHKKFSRAEHQFLSAFSLQDVQLG